MAEQYKVLLVDDDVDFVEATKIVLESNDYEVVTAHNGKDGIAIAKKEKPDAIVLDVMMTHKTEGFDTARDLRNDEETKDIPIVMLTAVNQEVPWKFAADSVWLPVDKFVEKPIQPDKLLDLLGEVIK
ncbi:MAG: response regulator [Planctomycetota bacterium]